MSIGILQKSGWTAWDRGAFAAAVLVLAPIGALALTAALGRGAEIALAPIALGALRETLVLAAGVLAFAGLVGVAAAWLVSQFDFPGRRVLSFALVLPFAVPTYISAYCFVEFLDFFGPVQGALRAVTGHTRRAEYWFPEIMSTPGAVLVIGLVLYPYVYVAARAAFALQGAQLTDAARMLGASRFEAMRRAALPAIWPALAGALALVLYEVLNDIGASQHLGVNTFTVAIYATWLNKGSLAGAAQLALMALLLVLAVVWGERLLRKSRRYAAAARGYRPTPRARLRGFAGAAAAALCAAPVLLGFGVPAYVLGRELWRQLRSAGVPADLWPALGHSLLLAGIATAAILFVAMALAAAGRMSRRPLAQGAVAAAGLGYALPGTVLVIGLLPLAGLADQAANWIVMALGRPRLGQLLSGSLAVIVLAYAIRFLAIGLEQARAGLGQLSPNADAAAVTLGATRGVLAGRILFPAMRTPMAGAAVLVFVDCLKELPATLLLRPLNVETLATLLYGHAARGSFEDGAMAAALIVLAGLVPLVLVDRVMDAGYASRR